MPADDKPRRNPTTGRYKPTKRALAFRKVVRERRAEVAEAAKLQRQINRDALKAVIAKAEAATARARAAEAAAQAAERVAKEAAQPTTAATEDQTPGDGDEAEKSE